MAGTFATEITREGGRWIAYAQVESWGRRHGALAGYRDAYRWATRHPYDHGYPAANADSFIDFLDVVPAVSADVIDLREGRTDLGGLDLTFLDGPIRDIGNADHGWGVDVLTDLLAHQGPGNVWNLMAGVTAAAGDTTWTVDSVAGMALGDALWVDAEVAIITNINGGAFQITVVRAQYGTRLQAHPMTPTGEGVLYDRPQFLRGRQIGLFVNLFDSRTGELMADTQAVRVWRGIITSAHLDGINRWTIGSVSGLGRLETSLGRGQWTVRAGSTWTPLGNQAGEILDEAATGEAAKQANQQTLTIPWDRAETEGGQVAPDYPSDAGILSFHARHGDQIIECRYNAGNNQLSGVAWGLLSTAFAAPGAEPFNLWDVLLSCPSPLGGQATPLQYFLDAAGVPTSHPIDIMLALMTSTGTSTRGPFVIGTNGDWDCLPRHWGAGIPIGEIATGTWLALRGRMSQLKMTRHVIGHEGEPFKLREWMEKEILGPLGWFLFLDGDGKIAIGSIAELYPKDSWPAILDTDILQDPDTAAPRVEYDRALYDTTSYQTWKYAYSLAKQEFLRTLQYRHTQVLGRDLEDNSEITFEARGLSEDGASAFIRSRAEAFARWFISPLPRVKLSIGMHKIAAAVTDGIMLTCSVLPNPFTGTRGIAARPAVLLSRALDFERGEIEIEVLLLPEANVGLWAPSGLIHGYDPGGPVWVDIENNEYTSTDGGPDSAPDRDSEAFLVGDKVMGVSRRGVVLTAGSVPVITAITPGGGVGGRDRITLDAAFFAPVAAGDVLSYCHYAGGSPPQAVWTTDMKACVAQADVGTGLLLDDSPPYVYGGQ